ncbi:MAG: hypothetical protein ABH808_02990 [Candidatus Kuenenbacteria bacterium]
MQGQFINCPYFPSLRGAKQSSEKQKNKETKKQENKEHLTIDI